jgi:hypothetical protein
MYQAVALFIVVVGTIAIFYTIIGAVSGRNMTIGLILAGSILAVQALGLAYSAIKDPPPSKDAPAEESAEPSPSSAAPLILTG